ncbi:MAG: hypothetical protein Q8P18_06240 [Pseudomonadota bacterium]|nr:hypothetical protein [Pseudomonadota bacterium]
MRLFLHSLAPLLVGACKGEVAFECPATPVEGAEKVLSPGTVLLLGEMHGTEQAPDVAGRLACQAAAAGHSVALGLEMPADIQDALARSVTTPGPAAANELMAHAFWLREDQDGRSSGAMLALVLRAGEWHRNGADISLFAFDMGRGEPGVRDQGMAERVTREAERMQEGVVIGLVGNIHPRRGPFAAEGLDFTPMGAHLDALGSRLLALNVAYSGGTAWACYSGEGCRNKLLRGTDRGSGQFIELFPEPDRRGFHGSYYVGAITASGPALQRR